MTEREERAVRTRNAGMEPCERCGLPAEPATDYCGGCWPDVMRDREIIARELGVAAATPEEK